jgi:hypothetical protein
MLTAELPEGVTETKEGKGNNEYLKTGYVINRLNQVFGFDGWSMEVVHSELHKVWEDNGRWFAIGTSRVRLTVYAGYTITREDVGTCCPMAQRQLADAVDIALKGAVSDGLKRCARTWGTQFGVYDADHRRQNPAWWTGPAAEAVQARIDRRSGKVGQSPPPPARPPQRVAEDRSLARSSPATPTHPGPVPARPPAPMQYSEHDGGDAHRVKLSKALHALVHQVCKKHHMPVAVTLDRVKGLCYRLAKVEHSKQSSTWGQVGPLYLKRGLAVAENMLGLPSGAAALDYLAEQEVGIGLPPGGVR